MRPPAGAIVCRQTRRIIVRIDRTVRCQITAFCSSLIKGYVLRDPLKAIVAKWARGRYETDGVSTSWLKIKNSRHSQREGRRELFEERRNRCPRSRHGC
jgi:hypothetical protein